MVEAGIAITFRATQSSMVTPCARRASVATGSSTVLASNVACLADIRPIGIVASLADATRRA
jgi:hypothetical protein